MADEADSEKARIAAARSNLRAAVERAYRRFPQEKQRATEAARGGLFGRIIGDSAHHAGSIAFMSVLGLLIILLVSVVGLLWHVISPPNLGDAKSIATAADAAASSGAEEIRTIIQSLIALIGTILGYLFGKSKQD